MPINRIELDRYFRLFQLTERKAENLLIIAKGGYFWAPRVEHEIAAGNMVLSVDRFLMPPWISLHFYVGHNQLLDQNINFMDIIKDMRPAREIIQVFPGDPEKYLYDYRLFKNKRITQDIIEYQLEYMLWFAKRPHYKPFARPHIPQQFDILTIRNRLSSMVGGISLSTLLKAIKKTGHRYTQIHCLFGRNLL